MIKGIIIVNNSGQARICKFFQQVHREGYSPEEAQQSVVQQVYKQVSERPDSFCNYLEGSIMQWGDDTKLIYRHYATSTGGVGLRITMDMNEFNSFVKDCRLTNSS